MHSYQNNSKKSSTAKINMCTVTRCLQTVHLIQQEMELIATEVKTIWKGFVRI